MFRHYRSSELTVRKQTRVAMPPPHLRLRSERRHGDAVELGEHAPRALSRRRHALRVCVSTSPTAGEKGGGEATDLYIRLHVL